MKLTITKVRVSEQTAPPAATPSMRVLPDGRCLSF
jgi:hypothetical protein